MAKSDRPVRAIITDLDRTLLRTDKTLSPATCRVLHQCHEQGLAVLVATARPARALQRYQALLPLDAMTTLNGAVTLLPGQTIEEGIPAATVTQLLSRFMVFPDVLLSLETSQGIYANRPIPAWNAVVYPNFPHLPSVRVVYKLLASSPQPCLYQQLPQCLTPDVYATLAGQELIQVMSRRATKWRGIAHMLASLSIDPTESFYFGDDTDDLEPIQRCGTGIAVANAIDIVRQAADDLTASNDEDGVARYLMQRLHLSKSMV